MKVICKINNIYELQDEGKIARLKKYIRLSSGQLNIEIDSTYVVYGIVFRDNAPWYYLCPFEDDDCPNPFPAELFDVVENSLSRYWQLSTSDHGEGKVFSTLVFMEWAIDTSFYERLVDDDPQAVKIFLKYKQLMHQEAPA